MIATLLAIVTLFTGDPEGHVRLRPSDDRTAAMIALGHPARPDRGDRGG